MANSTPALDFLRKPNDLGVFPVYAVFGAEDYLRRKCLRVLSAGLEGRGFEVKRVEPDDSIAPLLDELRSPSMFGGAIAAVVTNRRIGNRQEVTTRFKEELLKYIEAPSKRNVLVFDAATWQRNLAVPKRVTADFPTVICEELKPWDVRGWQQIVNAAAADLDLKIAPDALNLLREYTGGNLGRADSELNKLALLAKGGRVTASDVAQACGYEGADVTFALCDALLTGDSKSALSHAAKMAGKAELGTVLSLIGLLRLQVAGLGRAAIAMRQGADTGDAIAGAKLRLRENMKPAFARTAQGLDIAHIRAGVEILMNADEAMKTSSPDPANLLVGTVAKLCEVLHSAKPGAASGR